MKKPIKKTWMIASALTIGMAVLTPLQAGATAVEPTNAVTVQIEQQITGTIKSVHGDGINLKARDGKNYFISFFKFSDEQLEQMNLVEGQEITVEGGVVEDYLDFYTFEVYKKDLPKNVPNDELTKLEKMFSEVKKLEKEASNAITNKKMDEAEKKYEEMNKIYEEMNKITKPYYLASWQPQPFEEFLEDYGFSENNIVIAENDKKELKAIYEEWVKLEKDGQDEKAKEKMKGFNKILQPYLDELYPTPTFEEYIGRLDLIDIPAETITKLKNIYEDVRKAEREENYDLFGEIWAEFHDILGQFIIPQTFEEYMSSFEFKVSNADSKQLKQLYEEILKLDRKEDSAKIEEKWEAFYNILEPYFEAIKAILISASKITINGQNYLPQ
ncbi:hypothetical protein ACFTQ7_19955 [Lysinibacillus sp. NPDC056959]|uniref:hypothetical protein n=1 Tax=Lysinibacillus sp. NPDC056959 TaxID=3345981 RepID=UPI0036408518